MTARYQAAFGAGVGLAGLLMSGAAYAASCNCTPPPSCNCTVPTGHQITVPGVSLTPPSIFVNAPSVVVAAPNIEVQTGSVAVANASSTATATSSASATGTSSANSLTAANAQANALGAIYNAGGGGGSSFSASEGGSSYIPNLDVESVEGGEGRRVCAEMRAAVAMTAVQAVCLDDKSIPHPASQVNAERDVLPTYEGEVFRCIAGARMQYTLAEFNGQASFDHGQTITCQKGEALYHSGAGQLACRPQAHARDCNERSLLRRFGAGIKVLKLARAQQCVAWRTETAKAQTTTIMLDGGVGGVVR